MKEWGCSPLAIALIARNTLAEAVRQKLPAALVLVAAALVAGVQGLREFNFGAPELKFIADFGLGAMGVFGPILTIAATTQLFLGELEQRTAQTLLAKPVRRTDFLAGKLCAVLVLNFLFCAVLTALLLVLLHQREAALWAAQAESFPAGTSLFSAAEILAAASAQWWKLAVLASGVLLLASFARTQLYTLVASFLLFAICQMQGFAQQAWGRSEHWAGQLGATLLGLVFPDFQVFELSEKWGAIDFALVARVWGYGGAYVLGLGLLAAIGFRQREL